MNAPGIYGKLPTHGDFVQRNLSSAFVAGWDMWLQQFISGSKEQIGVDWLDIYLTSPIWRFVLSHGVIDENSWAGIMMPSVDQVGRYFPFTIALMLPEYVNPLAFMSAQTTWYIDLEDVALQALDGEYEIDDLLAAIADKKYTFDSQYSPNPVYSDDSTMFFEQDFEEQSANVVYPYMLDVLLNKHLNSYSIWSTAGSERIMPCVFSVKNLPPVSKLPAMLDGEWIHWGWQNPYILESSDSERSNDVAL